MCNLNVYHKKVIKQSVKCKLSFEKIAFINTKQYN